MGRKVKRKEIINVFDQMVAIDKLAVDMGLYYPDEGLSAEFLKYFTIKDMVKEQIEDL